MRQEIPAEVIDNAERLWNPRSNEVWAFDSAGEARGPPSSRPAREPDTRYQRLLDVFQAVRQADPYHPGRAHLHRPALRARSRDPRARGRGAADVSVLQSAEFRDIGRADQAAARAAARSLRHLVRRLQGRGSAQRGGARRDRARSAIRTSRRSRSDLPRILETLGFTAERAAWLADHIVVDPSRGAGHAMGAVRREDKAHLRTRFGKNGMDYKGYNIAVHELGHNVEQVFSLNGIDHWCAERRAQQRVHRGAGVRVPGPRPGAAGPRRPGRGGAPDLRGARRRCGRTCEIGGVALVDMRRVALDVRAPRGHPGRAARGDAADRAREVWNRYYAPAFGGRDQEILAIYSHMIVYGLYLPDYPIGHIIAFQVGADPPPGTVRRGVRAGGAAGPADAGCVDARRGRAPISAQALLAEARRALDAGTR